MTTIGAACPLCGNHATRLLAESVRFERMARVLRCENCTLVFLDQASFKFPAEFYQHAYHQTYLTHVDPEMLDPGRHYDKMCIASKPWVDKLRSMLSGTEVVLDVGCSTGHILTGIRDRAAQVFGHELNRIEIAYCRDRHNLDVSDTPLNERFQFGSFDYVLLMFVLEHIGEPLEFLRYLKQFLKPTGKLIILVPNVEDALLQFFSIPAFAGFYFCIEHLFYYSPKTIRELFDRTGLEGSIETLQEYPITNHLNWGYRQRPSETLTARRMLPDIPLQDEGRLEAWEQLWSRINVLYQQFLAGQGFSDRIWCEVG
jgi:SAM-dependent methyltransferase